MEFINVRNGEEGTKAMAKEISGALAADKKVLWLICGGSNIPLAKEAMDMMRADAGSKIVNLTVGQTDERYGDMGHPDSNWQQMIEAGFNFEGVGTRPILFGGAGEETVLRYANMLAEDFASNDLVVAQFGIGADGHVAGMLPHTGGLDEEELAFGYDSAPFVRITMTPPAFAHVHCAYAFAFGESKRQAIASLQTKELPASEEPSQLLKTIPRSYFYSDQVK
jgi:6-phosphogluconolactonase/glucosamine-6-phosphate isomerase/deaminase